MNEKKQFNSLEDLIGETIDNWDCLLSFGKYNVIVTDPKGGVDATTCDYLVYEDEAELDIIATLLVATSANGYDVKVVGIIYPKS